MISPIIGNILMYESVFGMSLAPIDVGTLFAYAYYCPQLHRDQAASTYAFSELRWFNGHAKPMGVSRITNILWQGSHRMDVDKIVKAQFDGAEYRGLFTTKNYLLIGEGQEKVPLRVVGPLISLNDFVNGPIARVEEPSGLEAHENVVKFGSLQKWGQPRRSTL